MGTFGVISADSHVYEPPHLWPQYIDPEFKDRAPHVIQDGADEKYVIDGLGASTFGLNAMAGKKSEDLSPGSKHAEGPRGGWDPEARVKDMDLDGIDAEVLYPSMFNLFRVPDSAYQAACFRAYNDWLADLCGSHPERLTGVGLIPLEDADSGAGELRRVAKKGLRSGMIACAARDDRPFSDPSYDPLWAEAEALGMPIALHAITEAQRQGAGYEFMVTYSTMPVITQRSLAVFIAGGVLERYPNLKIVSVENDIGWAGTFLRRLDHAFERHRFWSGSGTRLSKRPSEYFQGQVLMTFQEDKPGIAARDFIGVDSLMWASDHPHSDSTWPESRRFIQEQFGDLPGEERDKIVRGNAAALYGLS